MQWVDPLCVANNKIPNMAETNPPFIDPVPIKTYSDPGFPMDFPMDFPFQTGPFPSHGA